MKKVLLILLSISIISLFINAERINVNLDESLKQEEAELEDIGEVYRWNEHFSSEIRTV